MRFALVGQADGRSPGRQKTARRAWPERESVGASAFEKVGRGGPLPKSGRFSSLADGDDQVGGFDSEFGQELCDGVFTGFWRRLNWSSGGDSRHGMDSWRAADECGLPEQGVAASRTNRCSFGSGRRERRNFPVQQREDALPSAVSGRAQPAVVAHSLKTSG